MQRNENETNTQIAQIFYIDFRVLFFPFRATSLMSQVHLNLVENLLRKLSERKLSYHRNKLNMWRQTFDHEIPTITAH